MATAHRCSHPREEGLLRDTRASGKLKDLMLYSPGGHNLTPFAVPTAHCALQQRSCNSVPKGNPSATHLPLDASKSNIGGRDSPEIDVRDTEEVYCLSGSVNHHMPRRSIFPGTRQLLSID